MILSNIFKLGKKEEPPQKPPEIPFSIVHPEIVNLPDIPAEVLAFNRTNDPSLQPLVNWLCTNPSVLKAISFRVQPIQVTPESHYFRKYAIKAQMNTGINLLTKIEKIILMGPKIQTFDTDFAFPPIKDVEEARKIWSKIKINNYLMGKIQKELDLFAYKYTIVLKDITATLLSFIVSTGIIPSNYIPVINFDQLDMSNEQINISDEKCLASMKKVDVFRRINRLYLKRLSEIHAQYLPTETMSQNDIIENAFNDLIESYKNSYDVDGECFGIETDMTPFIDFIHFPLGNKKFVSAFFESPSKKTYDYLVKGLIEDCNLFSDSWPIVRALCSASFACMMIPSVMANGSGCEDPKILECGLDLMWTFDPRLILQKLGGENGPGQTIPEKIAIRMEGLKALTKDWLLIVQFVLDFVDPDTVSWQTQEIRTALEDYANSE